LRELDLKTLILCLEIRNSELNFILVQTINIALVGIAAALIETSLEKLVLLPYEFLAWLINKEIVLDATSFIFLESLFDRVNQQFAKRVGNFIF